MRQTQTGGRSSPSAASHPAALALGTPAGGFGRRLRPTTLRSLIYRLDESIIGVGPRGVEVTLLDSDPTRWLHSVSLRQRESRTCLMPSPTSTNQPPRAGSAPLCLPRREGATLGPGAVGSASKGEGQSRQTDQVEIPFQAATFCLVATLSDPGS